MCSTISFQPYSGDIRVSAIEVNTRQWGVCRDLSHLGIALCRSLSILARMVVGYPWFEADVAVYNQYGPALSPTWQQVSVALGRQRNGTV